MASDASGIILLVITLSAALAYGLTHFRRQFVWLYIFTGIIWVMLLFLLSVSQSNRGLLYTLYPWSVPLLFLLPTCVQFHTNALFKIKSEDWVFYLLYLMPIFSLVSSFGILADEKLYQKNVDLLIAGEFLEVNHLLGVMRHSLTYLTSFSLLHAVLSLKRIRDGRFTGPIWLYNIVPWLQLFLSAAGLLAIVFYGLRVSSGQFMLVVLSVVSIALATYVVASHLFEEHKLTSVVSDAMFFTPSKHDSIESYLRNLNGDAVRVLFRDFTKTELAIASMISSSTWNSFLHEQRLSWPEFKNRVRIRYALQELQSGYLASKTVESLSLELGFQSRKSFYTAYEAITGNSFRREMYR